LIFATASCSITKILTMFFLATFNVDMECIPL
jgi:hypothetical protein